MDETPPSLNNRTKTKPLLKKNGAGLCPTMSYHYKTISLIINPIISSEPIVRTIGLIVRTIKLIVRTISPPWDPGGR